ncbi:serine/threonine-protein kinase dst2 [Drosophila elegans]|uniref:serine/threonine-protein kinase dst2 n=1 Tax=Drosophila elegans TaxID=30023 RepID=UPI0007E78555|nr:serine/threonine-protein kinase dst2 [Drosophila elegans]
MLETKSIAELAFIDRETPRKRKRETAPPPLPLTLEKDARQDAAVQVTSSKSESCFTNAAFSSTPKKLIGRRRLAKENSNPFPGFEVKSIADLAQKKQQPKQQQQQQPLSTNPFEVLRDQPSKKKKREHACFENPGLNLELPEKQFNPYEVIRLAATPAKGFVNPGLNLRGSDAPASLNPFEIHRPSEASEAACNPAGVANPALADRDADAEEPLPTSLKIGLPFTPTLGCRIDFHGMSLAQLTPSKLLAEKLVFSPVPAPKRSLGAISEESSSMDIGRELDRYQLELENSINEAKLRKNGVELEPPKNAKISVFMETDAQESMMQEVQVRGDPTNQVERRLVCTRRRTLTEITEDPEVEETKEQDLEQEALLEQERLLEREKLLERERHLAREQQLEREKLLEREKHLEREKLQEQLHEQLREKLQERVKQLAKEKQQEDEEQLLLEQQQQQKDGEGEDVAYASESEEEPDDDLDFKAPARFVRAYRPAALPTKATSKESLHSIASSKSSKSVDTKPTGGMKSMIRKSIRRLMHPTHSSPEKTEDKEAPTNNHQHHHHNLLNSIRHSLRRRPQKSTDVEHPMEPTSADISIVDSSERTMKLRSSVPQTEYMTIDQLTNEKKHTLRNSIRRSTRDVLRHVFHKSHDAYATAK